MRVRWTEFKQGIVLPAELGLGSKTGGTTAQGLSESQVEAVEAWIEAHPEAIKDRSENPDV